MHERKKENRRKRKNVVMNNILHQEDSGRRVADTLVYLFLFNIFIIQPYVEVQLYKH
jgi:hypothetical protein